MATALIQVRLGEGIHFGIRQRVEPSSFRPVNPIPSDHQEDEDRNVDDFRQKPEEVAGELLIA